MILRKPEASQCYLDIPTWGFLAPESTKPLVSLEIRGAPRPSWLKELKKLISLSKKCAALISLLSLIIKIIKTTVHLNKLKRTESILPYLQRAFNL